MRTLFLLAFFLFVRVTGMAQTLAGDLKVIDIGANGVGDYTRTLILLHEIYNGTPIEMNYAIGTLTALRGHAGAYNRTNVAQIHTSSAYNAIQAQWTSVDNNADWRLKTCVYNGKKYLAAEVPPADAHHNLGYKFIGRTVSGGENMKAVNYMVGGQPVNTQILTSIEDFQANMTETHFVKDLNVMGNVGIGTVTPGEKLAVNGTIRAKEIKVEATNWPDYVFAPGYRLLGLKETQQHIQKNGHLPGIPSAKEAEAHGVGLGELNKKLLEKIEELTLHLIRQQEEIDDQRKEINQLKEQSTGRNHRAKP